LITSPQYLGSCHREPPRAPRTVFIGLNAPELLGHFRAGLHRRMVLP
jgi:hypothetical protein